MADDDNGVKPAGPSSPEHAAGGATPSTRHPSNEWTASDRRGPLDAAGDEDVERFVPAHETDAEGGVDPTSTATHEPVSGEPDRPVLPDEPLPPSHVETTPAAVVEPPRRSFVPVVAGVVIGALIGAGSAWLVYSQASGGAAADHQQVASLAARVDALDKRPDPQSELATLQSGLDGLRGKVASLDKQVSATPAKPTASAPSQTGVAPAPATDTTLAGKVAGLQAALADLKTRTAALQQQDQKESSGVAQIAALQTGVADARKQAEGNQADLDGVKSGQKQLGDRLAALATAVAAAQKDASGVQSSMASVQSQQKALEDRLGSPALAVVADSLVQQIDAGRPYGRQVDALAALKADPAKVAVLRENAGQGVASAQTLLAKWTPLETPVIATGNVAPANANFGQRLEHGLFGLVSVRRADVATGNDLAARVAAIQTDLAGDDVPAAYAAWQALPAPAKEKSADWGTAAKASAEALAAAHDLQHAAIDALAARKS